MDPIIAGTICMASMLLLVAARVPVAIAMGSVAAVGMWYFGGINFMLTNFETLPYNITSQYAFVVIPMFVLMGAIAAASGLTGELYAVAHRWTAGLRGSLYYATIGASAGFAAINGATLVSALVFTRVALPEMLRFGYNAGLSGGCICAAGTFAALIPPSIIMIIYAILANESIGQLLIAGIIPGVITVIIYAIGLNFYLRIRPNLAPEPGRAYSLREKLESLKQLWAVILLIFLVLGGIYSGLMFPSAAGAVGAVGALLIGWGRRTLGWSRLWFALKQSASTTAVIFFIIIGGLLFSRLLLVTGYITGLTGAIEDFSVTPWMFIALVVLLYLILGMFVDTISMMVMTIPFLDPIATQLGIDGIWFGVIICKLIEIAAITPPVGLNLYAVLSAADGKIQTTELFLGVIPFLFFEAITLGLIVSFPQLSLWLPQTMMQ